MDIKHLGNNIIPTVNAIKAPSVREMRSEHTTDRDANGQQGQQSGEHPQALTEEELEKAIQYLKTLAGIKENGLYVKLARINGRAFVIIEEPNGKIVRRIPETDLFHLLQRSKDDSNKTGNLLDKAG